MLLLASPNQKKKQDKTSGILGGIIKGFSGGKVEHNVDLTEAQKTGLTIQQLLGMSVEHVVLGFISSTQFFSPLKPSFYLGPTTTYF